MELQTLHSTQIISIDKSESGDEPSITCNKICGGTTCGFFNSTNSKDAKERFASVLEPLIAVILCIVFMAVEVVGGIKADSLAILTDATHLLSDVAAFAISLFSIWASGWEATPCQSYGFFRIEILGDLVSNQLKCLLNGILVYKAIARLIHDTGEVQGILMFGVAASGLLVNIIMAVLLGREHGQEGHNHSHGRHEDSHNGHGHDEHSAGVDSGDDDKFEPQSDAALIHVKHDKDKMRNINVKGAYLHFRDHSIQSVFVMIGGAIIWWKPEWQIIDMLWTLFSSVIDLIETIKMLRDILEVLMQSTPRQIDATKLETGLCQLDGVIAIHELHIWAITVGKVLLACHVTIAPEADSDLVLDTVIGYIKREYNISHVTIQIERQ